MIPVPGTNVDVAVPRAARAACPPARGRAREPWRSTPREPPRSAPRGSSGHSRRVLRARCPGHVERRRTRRSRPARSARSRSSSRPCHVTCAVRSAAIRPSPPLVSPTVTRQPFPLEHLAAAPGSTPRPDRASAAASSAAAARGPARAAAGASAYPSACRRTGSARRRARRSPAAARSASTISQYHAGRPKNAKTKIAITITQSRNAVPQRTWIRLCRCTRSGVSSSPAS